MIDLNVGIVEVLDECLDKLIEFVVLKKIVFIVFEFVDIVGFVCGVSKGEGLGNKFFVYICEVDVIVYVVCCFVDENIIYVDGKIDLVSDIQMINLELILVDIESVEKKIECFKKNMKGGNKQVV